MDSSYKKTLYLHPSGFRLSHTAGSAAGDSTLGYLHYTTQSMLIYFIRGTGSIKVEGRHYRLEQGDLILLNPTELYHCAVDDAEYHERIVIYFDPSVLSSFPGDTSTILSPLFSRPKGTSNHIPRSAVESTGMADCLTALLRLVPESSPASTVLSQCRLAELLILTAQLLQPGASALPLSTAQENPLVSRVITYLNAHFHEELSLASVASEFHMTPSYLSHLFKEHTGMSLWNYVVLRRLRAFNDLLRMEYSVEQACYQVGFRNYSNFFRLYTKHTGLTPSQYKKQLSGR